MNFLSADGYRYGVMFNDGSVMAKWNGKTQRERAEEEIREIIAQQLERSGRHDNIRLARRTLQMDWEVVNDG